MDEDEFDFSPPKEESVMLDSFFDTKDFSLETSNVQVYYFGATE